MMMAWSKFSMLVDEIKCLGFIVNADGIRPDEERCRELVEWPEPTTKRELWSYLGLYAYLAHTMPQSTTVMYTACWKWLTGIPRQEVVAPAGLRRARAARIIRGLLAKPGRYTVTRVCVAEAVSVVEPCAA